MNCVNCLASVSHVQHEMPFSVRNLRLRNPWCLVRHLWLIPPPLPLGLFCTKAGGDLKEGFL